MIKLFCLASHLLLLTALTMSHPVPVFPQAPPVTEEQLEFVKNNPSFNDKGDMIYVTLLGYTYKGIIGSEEHKSRILDSLFFKDAPYVIHYPPIEITDTTTSDTCVRIETIGCRSLISSRLARWRKS